MIYILPTKKGLGIELWGNYDDIVFLHKIISKFWNIESTLTKGGFENRDKLISGFSYEIRKCYEGSRLKKSNSHFSFEKIEYLGVEISWVHFLFSLSALRYNMRYVENNKMDLSLMLHIEFWLENAMNKYDKIGADKLAYFISDGIYAGNNYLYQFMRSINADYFRLNGEKKAFRKLPELLMRSVAFSEEYKFYTINLEEEAKRLGCKIENLDINDEDIDYENIKW